MSWQTVCLADDLTIERGVAALVDGAQVALFRLADGSVHALDQWDPCCGANVLSRGIVGTRTVNGRPVPVVASPMYKQSFDLRTGECLDRDDVRVSVWSVRLNEGRVQVRPPTDTSPQQEA